MKSKSRENIDKILRHDNQNFYRSHITDHFGENLAITFWNVLTSLSFWIIYFIPFIFIFIVFITEDTRVINFIKAFSRFLMFWFVFFLIVVPIETFINEHRVKHLYHKKITYNQSRLKSRKNWLKHYYQKKFGNNLHFSNIYYVQSNNNIPVDYIIKHYKKQSKENRNKSMRKRN